MIQLKRRPQPTPEATATDQAVETTPEVPPSGGIETWTRRNDLIRRAQTALVLGCLGCAPLALGGAVWSANRPVSSAVITGPTSSERVDVRGRVGQFARDGVVVWLNGTRATDSVVRAWFPMAVAVTQDKHSAVTDAQVVSVDQLAAQDWAVVISASVDGSRMQFQVPVRYTTTGALSMLALPQPVAGPLSAGAQENPLQEQVNLASELGTTVAGFVNALSAGHGDLSRYIRPQASIRPIQPSPFTQVEVTGIVSDYPIPQDRAPNEGGAAQLMVTATGTTKQKVTQSVSWVVTVVVRDGRWEIASLDSVPGIRGATPQIPSAGQLTQPK